MPHIQQHRRLEGDKFYELNARYVMPVFDGSNVAREESHGLGDRHRDIAFSRARRRPSA